MDELEPKLRKLLDAARDGHDPDERDAQRVRGAIFAALGRGDSPAAPDDRAAASAAPHAAASTGKWIGALLIAGGLATFGALQTRRDTPAARPSAVTIERAAPRAPEPSPVASDPAPEPRAHDLPPPPAPLPQANAPRHERSHRAARGAAAPTRAVPPQGPSELSLIREATRALRDGRAAHALELLDQHARVHPGGMLRQERQGLRVLALCELGHTKQGREERQRFLATAAHSPLAGRVGAACADPETP